MGALCCLQGAEVIYQGINIIESTGAVSKPKGCIHTDDMRAMIDHFEELGLIQMVPASFRLPNGSIVMHPSLMPKFRRLIGVFNRGVGWSY